jgi:hypothetical protein
LLSRKSTILRQFRWAKIERKQTPPETSAHDVEKKKAEPKTPHFPSLNQDIVARSEEAKVEIKVCNIQSGQKINGAD